MPPQQQLYNGLARPADYCIFLHGNGLPRLWASSRWHKNGLARTVSVLGYGRRGWLAYSEPAGLACGRHGTNIKTDRQRDRQRENVMPPRAGYAA